MSSRPLIRRGGCPALHPGATRCPQARGPCRPPLNVGGGHVARHAAEPAGGAPPSSPPWPSTPNRSPTPMRPALMPWPISSPNCAGMASASSWPARGPRSKPNLRAAATRTSCRPRPVTPPSGRRRRGERGRPRRLTCATITGRVAPRSAARLGKASAPSRAAAADRLTCRAATGRGHQAREPMVWTDTAPALHQCRGRSTGLRGIDPGAARASLVARPPQPQGRAPGARDGQRPRVSARPSGSATLTHSAL